MWLLYTLAKFSTSLSGSCSWWYLSDCLYNLIDLSLRLCDWIEALCCLRLASHKCVTQNSELLLLLYVYLFFEFIYNPYVYRGWNFSHSAVCIFTSSDELFQRSVTPWLVFRWQFVNGDVIFQAFPDATINQYPTFIYRHIICWQLIVALRKLRFNSFIVCFHIVESYDRRLFRFNLLREVDLK